MEEKLEGLMERLISAFGLVLMIFLAWCLSSHKKDFSWRIVLTGVGLQIGFGVLILWTEPGRFVFSFARDFITELIQMSDVGAAMIFGENFRDHFFAFSVLPTIIFVSSLMAVLFHLGLIQKLVKLFAWLMWRVMKTSGSESLCASANVFIGQTEAPLVVKPYINTMTRSEIMAMMVGGMATVAGGVMVAYVSFGADAGHLLAASIMSAPAALVIAKIMLPEREDSPTRMEMKIEIPKKAQNVLDAACRGAGEGLWLALNVAAMLIAFVALAALLNYFLQLAPDVAGAPLSFERILGWLFVPIAWALGVSGSDVFEVAQLLGKKVFLNEFLAYIDLGNMKTQISERSFIISTYALCGFANFSSIAIQIGGIGNLVPERRADFAKLGFKAMLGGVLAANMTACVAGIFV